MISVFRQLLGRPDVALVEQHDARRERERVCAISPLLALLIDRFLSATVNRIEIELRFLQRVQERFLFVVLQRSLREIDRRDFRGFDSAREDHRRIDETFIATDEREHGVEMHERALFRQLDGDDRAHAGVAFFQRSRELAHSANVGSFSDADEQQITPRHEHIAALECRRVARHRALRFRRHQIDAQSSAKRLVILEDVLRKQRFASSRLCRHRGDDDAVADDDLRIAHEEKIRDRKQIECRQIAALLFLVRNSADQDFGERRWRLIEQIR